MELKIITPESVAGFAANLAIRERSIHTVSRYLHDVRSYASFLEGQEASGQGTLGYKRQLMERKYAPGSVNTILASLRSFFQYMGWRGCETRRIVIQRDAYCPEKKELTQEEYAALLKAAGERDRLLLETICSTGIRVSELQHFTLENVRRREICVSCKSKLRRVMVPETVGRKLEDFAQRQGITSGVIFPGREGKPLGRRRIWAIMKEVGEKAGVELSKVFPHNLRKLFARTFYDAGKDVVKLADVLGHSSIETTRIYTRTSGTEHRRLLDALALKLPDPDRQPDKKPEEKPEGTAERKDAKRPHRHRKGGKGRRARK